jgi:hypothetical protein
MPLIAGQAILSLAKKAIPRHTVLGKAIGSTNTGAGVNLSKVAENLGAGSKVVNTISAIGQIGGNTSSLFKGSNGYASTLANSLQKAPAQTLVDNNLAGGSSPSTFSSIADANPPLSSLTTGPSPDGDGPAPKPADNYLKWVLIGAGVLYLLNRK